MGGSDFWDLFFFRFLLDGPVGGACFGGVCFGVLFGGYME